MARVELRSAVLVGNHTLSSLVQTLWAEHSSSDMFAYFSGRLLPGTEKAVLATMETLRIYQLQLMSYVVKDHFPHLHPLRVQILARRRLQ